MATNGAPEGKIDFLGISSGGANLQKIVTYGFYFVLAASMILIFVMFEGTDDSPNWERIATMSVIVAAFFGLGLVAISMGLMLYGLEENGENQYVRVAAILTSAYLLEKFLTDYNPTSWIGDILSSIF